MNKNKEQRPKTVTTGRNLLAGCPVTVRFKRNKRPYSLEQIAKWLGGKWYKRCAFHDTPYWQLPDGSTHDENLLDFYLPEHSWRVRDVVKKICVKRAWLIISLYDSVGCFMDIGRWPEEEKGRAMRITKRPEELAWIEALAELKRLEGENDEPAR